MSTGLATVTGAVVAGLIAVVLVALVARRRSRAIRAVTEAAAAAAAGQWDVRADPSSIAEVDRLGVAVNAMASELGRRVQESEGQRLLLEQILTAVRQGVVVVDADDHVTYFNRAAGEMIRPGDRLSLLAPHALQSLVREARANGKVEERTVETGAPPRLLAVAATPFPEDQRVLLVMADVTDARRLEAVRRDFVADASHELKTPVAAILATSEALEMALTNDPGAAARFGQQVQATARQMASLVNDLLDLSRLEAVGQEQEEIRLDQVAASEVAAARSEGQDRGVQLVPILEPVTVKGSAADLGQAIRNLLDNAIRHSSSGGTVTIGVGVGDHTATVEVVDTGEGIPQRDLPRIFERFYRVDSARARTTGGTGLGLSIVKHIVETHGGSITAESELGTGSTFRIALPIVR